MEDAEYRRIFASKLRYYMNLNGKNQMDLMRDLNLSSSTVSSWCTGQKLPRMGKIQMLADYFGINKSDLIENKVAHPISKSAKVIPAGFDPMPDMSEVPLVGEIACGQPITAEENLEGYVSVPECWHADFAMICRGKSMEPKIHDGDLVAIRAGLQIENGQVAAVRIGDEATLKRVYRYPERLILRPINEDFEEIVLEGEEINRASIEGKAVGLCRDM